MDGGRVAAELYPSRPCASIASDYPAAHTARTHRFEWPIGHGNVQDSRGSTFLFNAGVGSSGRPPAAPCSLGSSHHPEHVAISATASAVGSTVQHVQELAEIDRLGEVALEPERQCSIDLLGHRVRGQRHQAYSARRRMAAQFLG